QAWLREMVRVTKPSGSILVHHLPYWLKYFGCVLDELADFRHWIVWDSIGIPQSRSLTLSHYGILYYAKEKAIHNSYEIRAPHKRCKSCGDYVKRYGGRPYHLFGPLLSDCWVDIP